MELNKKPPTVKELAAKHKVPESDIYVQLAKDINVEKEHTTQHSTAKKIALAHIEEDPKYYTKLVKAGL